MGEVGGQDRAGANFADIVILAMNPKDRDDCDPVIVTETSRELDGRQGLEERVHRPPEEASLLTRDDRDRVRPCKGPSRRYRFIGSTPRGQLCHRHGRDLRVRSGVRLTGIDRVLPDGRVQRGPREERLEPIEGVTIVTEQLRATGQLPMVD